MKHSKNSSNAPAPRARRWSAIRVAIANALLLVGWVATALVPETLPKLGVGTATVAAVGAAIALPVRGGGIVDRSGSRIESPLARPPTGGRARPARGGNASSWRRT